MSSNLIKEIEISQSHIDFYNAVKETFKNRIYTDYLRRFALGTDASCYRYIPKIVIMAYSENEIILIINLSSKFNIPITFRAYGSSLSGQALSDSVLVISTFNWNGINFKEDVIRLSCGVIGSSANDILKPYGKKIGPDPATIAMASIGGIIANNSSGMCCGVKQNSYQTIKSIRVILYDGSILDTSSKDSIESFLINHKDMVVALFDLRDEILASSELVNLIKKKYKIKNTTGYGLNSLVDFSNIKDILNHIFVGSEGTLGFISSVELFVVDDCKFKACGLLFYRNMSEAVNAIKILANNDSIISSAEIMDYYSLKSVQSLDGIPEIIKEIEQDNVCILIQTENNNRTILEQNLKTIKDSLKNTNLILTPLYSQDEEVFNQWWKIRKGILPIAASSRDDETSVITEDVCFEIDKLSDGIEFIQNLFKKYDFVGNGIIFGHALSGNVHFIITPNLGNKKERENFENLVCDMAKGVSNFGGSIKAEHGTGRMVAPFVEIEWGKRAYEINCKIKHIFDPKNLINPDVIITTDKNIHTKNIKGMAKIDDFINKCMECGLCEKVCPSTALSLTPRQRITAIREMQRLKNLNTKDSLDLLKQMKKDYEYLGDETCAACSMCSTLCPLFIDTAQIALNLRLEAKKAEILAKHILKNISFYIRVISYSLNFAKIFKTSFLNKFSIQIRKLIPLFPYIPINLPQGLNFSTIKLLSNNMDSIESNNVVYFTSCMNRAFSPSKRLLKNVSKRSVVEVFTSLCKKANVNIIYPDKIENICCGKAFVNYNDLQNDNLKNLISILNKASNNGKIPIVLDHSACSVHLHNALKDSNLKIYDLPLYIYEFIAPILKFNIKNEDIAIYAMCALKKSKTDWVIEALAKYCTNGKIIKNDIFCCGFAGNKGFFIPELNRNALSSLKNFYDIKNLKRGFGSSITCEIGLNDYSGLYWQHIVYLVDESTY